MVKTARFWNPAQAGCCQRPAARGSRAMQRLQLGLVLVMGLLLAACGGGGSSDPVGHAPGTGSLGMTIGDNPVADFDEILVSVDSVSLIGGPGEGHYLLTDEPFTFDLLALDAATELLVAADDVPAGDYEKIRLELSSIELRRLDADGELEGDPVQATLLANGKLDLNPRGSFAIQDGGAVIVQLDIDAHRSFLAVQTGTGQIRFRPVVFVDLLGDGDLRRITFLTGTIQRLAAPEGDSAFELCDVRSLTGRGPGDRRLSECRRIDLADDAGIFDVDAETIDFGAVDDQSPAVVAGRLVAVEGEIGFEGLLVHLGERSDFKRIRGVVEADAVDGAFRLVGDDVGEEGLAVHVQPGALLFDQDGEILDGSVLTASTPVRVMGRSVPASEGEEARFLATAVAVDTTEAPEDDSVQLAGEITALEGERIDIRLDDVAGDACALFDADSVFTVVETDDEEVTSREGSADDLTVGARVEVHGGEGGGECVLADEIIVEIDLTEA